MTEGQALELIELLFFAYRDFISDPDEILKGYGFGRAHHRVVHFVGRNPGIRVAELLEILRITKQSLGRVLRELIETGFVSQQEGMQDRRQRLLFLTEKGEDLARRLAGPQIVRVREAIRACGLDADALYRDVLFHLIDPQDRANVRKLITKSEAWPFR
ncbi:MAG: MarR family winged helix-turn-helix transcriptional regulator [Hyphomicrobiales bacterium]